VDYSNDAKSYVHTRRDLREQHRYKIPQGNARRVYPGLDAVLRKRGKWIQIA
jgi:hypothetical protein